MKESAILAISLIYIEHDLFYHILAYIDIFILYFLIYRDVKSRIYGNIFVDSLHFSTLYWIIHTYKDVALCWVIVYIIRIGN